MDNVNIEVKRVTLVVGLCAAVIILLGFLLFNYLNSDEATDFTISDITSAMSAVLVTVGLVYTAESFQLTQKNHDVSEAREIAHHKELLFLQRKANAFAICEKFHEPDISLKVLKAHTILKDHEQVIENESHKFVDHLDNNFEDRKTILSMLNYFEHVSNSIIGDNGEFPSDSSFAEESVVRDSFKSLFVENYNKLKPFITKKYRNDPRAYKSFLKVGEYWRNN